MHITFGPSRGPGGQNVNKVQTCAILTFNVNASPSLTPEQRDRVCRALGRRISRAGELQLRSDAHRTQAANRRAVVKRFEELLASALRPSKPRRPTRPTRGARIRRERSKRLRSARKRERRSRGQAD